MPVINTYSFYQRSTAYSGLGPPTFSDRYRYSPKLQPLLGVVTRQPFSPYQSIRPGSHANPDYDKYFFGRVYGVLPDVNDFGLVSGLVQETLRFWNAAYSDSTVSDLIPEGAEQTVVDGLSVGQTLGPLGEVEGTFIIPENAEEFLDGSYTFVFENNAAEIGTFIYNFRAQKLEVWPDVGRSLEPNWDYGVQERFEMMTEVITSENNNEQRIAKREYPRHHISATFMITPELVPTFRLMMIKSDQQFLLPYWLEPHYIASNTPAGASGFTLDSPIENLAPGDYIVYESPTGLVPRQVLEQNGTDLQLGSPISQDITANARIWKGFYGRLSPETTYSRLTGTLNEAVLEFDVQNEVGKVLAEPFSNPFETYQGLPVLTRRSDWSQPLDAREFFQSDKLELGPNNRAYFYKWEESQRTEQMAFLNFSREDTADLRDFFLNRRARQQAFWRPSFIPDMQLYDDSAQSAGSSIRVTPGRLSEVYREGSSLYRNVMIQFSDGERRYYEIDSVTDGTDYATVVFTSQLGRDVRRSNVELVSWLYYVRFANDDFTIDHDTTKVSNVSLAVTTVKNRVGE